MTRGPLRSAVLLVLLAAACVPRPAPGPPPRPGSPPGLEDRALLLLLSDRRLYDPFTVERLLESRDPALRAELALSLGRIGDRRGARALLELLADRAPEVRRAAAFAAGLLGDPALAPALAPELAPAPALAPALLAAAADRDRETGRRAVEALARVAAPLADVLEALAELAPDERFERLLPPLFRFEPLERLPLAVHALAEAPPQLRPWAAYALARGARPEAAEPLRGLLADADPWVRGWAARALGEVGEGADLARLRPLVDDPRPGPIVQALRAAARLVADGRAAAPAEWRPRLVELTGDPRPGVRITALEVAGAWLPDKVLGARLAEGARRGGLRERQVSLLSLAAAGDGRAAGLAADLALETESLLRVAAAEAAGRLGLAPLLDRLARDPAPAVRLAALAARLSARSPPGAESGAEATAAALAALLSALEDPDPALRAAALERLAEEPAASHEAIRRAIRGPGSRRLVDVARAGTRALGARAAAEPLERGAIVAELEVLARDGDWLVRREAADALEALERPRPAVGPVEAGRALAAYRDLARSSAGPRLVDLETRHGTVRLRLDCPAAPLTCVNFLQLVGHGFFDGLAFHRVVPDFVVQGGDPRGDGWGGPGYTLRDEGSLIDYRRGVLGMARSGPDTAGSQFFITLSPQPHLDGAYTAFGEVVEGLAVLDRIAQWDRIERLREVPNSGAAGGKGSAPGDLGPRR